DRVETFAALDDRANRLAAVLEGMGAELGPPIAAVLPNGIEFFEVAMAAGKLGVPFLPINWHLKADELAYIVEDADVSVVVAGAEVAGRPTLVVCDAYEGAMAEADATARGVAGTVPSLVFYTSGTTARPKGVVHGSFTGEAIRKGMEG